MRPKAKTIAAPLQQAEFDALPYSVQRKYFSSLERLQIQQHALLAHDLSPPSSGRSSLASSSTPFGPALTLARHPRRAFSKPANIININTNTNTNTNTSSNLAQDFALAQAQADFFLSLPDKIRKQHFSRDEQHRLLQLARPHHSSSPDPYDAEWARQRFNDFRFDFDSDSGHSHLHQHALERGRSRSLSRSRTPSTPSISPCAVIACSHPRSRHDIQVYRPTHPLDIDTMSNSCATSTTISSSSRSPLASNPRRTMSMSATPTVRHSTTSTVLLIDAPLFPLSSPPHPPRERAQSASFTGRRSSHMPTPPALPAFDPDATHYQDPEARKKLRMYLASPQKFDEAIEFGFPSTATSDAPSPHYQLPPIKSHARNFSQDMQTFLKDGNLSFLEDDAVDNQGLDSDKDSVPDAESPTTPSSTGLSFRLHSRHVSSPKYSIDSPGLSLMDPANAPLNREMTLRMTLTRPDLRADEDQLYGWQASSRPKSTRNDDPLALEELVLTDDMTGTKGAFYIKPKPRGNLVTRLLKRASLKGR